MEQRKNQNLHRDYGEATRRLHDLGVMINGSFVFGMDGDDASVFERTVEWAIGQGIETATFHILTPYPGTALYRRMAAQGRMTTQDWDRYDTRHAVFQPAQMSADELEQGYRRAYRHFYRVGIDNARRVGARECDRGSAASRVCGRLEEIRAIVGCGHPCETCRHDAPGPRDDSQRVRHAGATCRRKCGARRLAARARRRLSHGITADRRSPAKKHDGPARLCC